MENSPAARAYYSPGSRNQEESIRMNDNILTKSSAGKENFMSPGNKSLHQSSLKKRKKHPHPSMPKIDYDGGNSSTYEPQTVLEMIRTTQKNPIALLHEFSSKIKKGIKYKYGIKNFGGSKDGNRNVFTCQIHLEKMGLLSNGEGFSKKTAKNNAGANAIGYLISNDYDSMNLIGELLSRQMDKTNRKTSRVKKRTPNPTTKMFPQQQIRKKSSQAFPPPPSNSISLVNLMKTEGNYLARLSFFANSLSMNLKWKFRTEKNMCITECSIGNMRASSIYKQKRMSKLLAARNLIKVIDSDPIMKQKFLTHLHSEKVKLKSSQPLLLDDSMTNFSVIKKMKRLFKITIDNTKAQTKLNNEKSHNEPNDMIEWFNALDKKISAPVDQVNALRIFLERFNNELKVCFKESSIQLIPVGSFALDCSRAHKLTADAYFHIEKENFSIDIDSIAQKLQLFFGPKTQNLHLTFKIKICDFSKEKYITVSQSEGSNPEHSNIHLYVINFGQTENSQERLLNRYTAGIFHSNWLVQNFSQSENAWQAVKLFRFVREWKDIQNFGYLPTEILDLTLKYATFNFDETGYFRVLLKFFTLLALMLTDHKDSFYDLSEYHSYLIDTITEEQRLEIIKSAQKTFLNLSMKNTDNFTRK